MQHDDDASPDNSRPRLNAMGPPSSRIPRKPETFQKLSDSLVYIINDALDDAKRCRRALPKIEASLDRTRNYYNRGEIPKGISHPAFNWPSSIEDTSPLKRQGEELIMNSGRRALELIIQAKTEHLANFKARSEIDTAAVRQKITDDIAALNSVAEGNHIPVPPSTATDVTNFLLKKLNGEFDAMLTTDALKALAERSKRAAQAAEQNVSEQEVNEMMTKKQSKVITHIVKDAMANKFDLLAKEQIDAFDKLSKQLLDRFKGLNGKGGAKRSNASPNSGQASRKPKEDKRQKGKKKDSQKGSQSSRSNSKKKQNNSSQKGKGSGGRKPPSKGQRKN